MEPSSSAAGEGGRYNPKNRNRKKRIRKRNNENTRRNKKNNKNKRGGGGGGSNANNNNAKKGPPTPSQTKIVIRNIGDVNRYGSVRSVIEMIRTILERTNQKMASNTSTLARRIQLEESSVQFLIQEEEEILKALAVEEEKANEEGKAENAQDDNNDGEETNVKEAGADVDAEVKEETTTNSSETEKKHIPAKFNDVVRGTNGSAGTSYFEDSEASTTNLSARVIYVVPPKETRRRGTKPGCAYLVIAGPRIEAKESPPVTTKIVAAKAVTEAVPVTDTPTTEVATDLPNPKSTSDEVPTPGTKADAETAQDEDAPALVTESKAAEPSNEHHVTIVDPKTDEAVSTTAAVTTTTIATTKAPPAPATVAVPPPDYSREIAKGRFLVQEAIELMAAHTKEDANADQNYAGSMVEVSMSGKTYRNKVLRRDRIVGSVQATADYKSFIKNKNKEKEEIMARPKPAPGGGALATSSATAALSAVAAATSVDVTEDGIPIAALVAHIRSKHEEASKRKKAKKKGRDSAGKEKGGSGKSSKKKKGRDGAKKEDDVKTGSKKKSRKKQRANKKRGGKEGTSPSMLLKPNGTGPATAGASSGGGGMGGFQGSG